MPKRQPKVRMASFGKIEPIALSLVEWRVFEGEYGHKLPIEVRKQLQDETLEYVAGALFEREAAPARAATEEINKIQRAAERLLRHLTPSQALDGAHYAKNLLLNRLDDDQLGHTPDKNPLTELTQVLTSCVDACDSARNELQDPNYCVHKGEAWARWIRRLTEILVEHHLPTKVSKAEVEFDKGSRFVRLIACLQGRVPRTCQEHGTSRVALAKAISAAQRQQRS